MMHPGRSLMTRILCCFFLNVALLAAVLIGFVVLQSQMNLHALFGLQGSSRLYSAVKFIAHDLQQAPQAVWPEILARHAGVHGVDFSLVMKDGAHFSSQVLNIPPEVLQRAEDVLRHAPPLRPSRPNRERADRQIFAQRRDGDVGEYAQPGGVARETPVEVGLDSAAMQIMMRTSKPEGYWSGIPTPLFLDPDHPPEPVLLFAFSKSVSGNGFFFDPLPWVLIAVAMTLLSLLIWIPMVRSITRPLGRMTTATEEIANGRFDVVIQERRGDEIGRLALAINHMTARLAAFVTGQKRFLGDVSHELGSPVARIQFGLGILEQRLQGENRTRLASVMDDVQHLADLISELLSFSRADMSDNAVSLEAVNVLSVVQTAIKREVDSAAEIRVEVGAEIYVSASAELLIRAIANVLRNALKYAGSAGPIFIAVTRQKNQVAITVQDSGPGIPDEFLGQIFEPFFRPEPSRARNLGGVGLGLAIVKTCVEKCQGRITMCNREPHGLAVTIFLKSEQGGADPH